MSCRVRKASGTIDVTDPAPAIGSVCTGFRGTAASPRHAVRAQPAHRCRIAILGTERPQHDNQLAGLSSINALPTMVCGAAPIRHARTGQRLYQHRVERRGAATRDDRGHRVPDHVARGRERKIARACAAPQSQSIRRTARSPSRGASALSDVAKTHAPAAISQCVCERTYERAFLAPFQS